MVDVDKHLLKHFKNSELYLFYQFLKTPQAKKIVKFEPHQNPKSFTFSIRNAVKISPAIERMQKLFVAHLRRQGLKVLKIDTEIWKFSHQTLRLRSNANEQMEVWFKAMAKFFMSTSKSDPYRALQNKEKMKWSSNGTYIILKEVDYNSPITRIFFQLGFSFKQNYAKHAFIKQDSPIGYWLLAYLNYLQQKRLSNADLRKPDEESLQDTKRVRSKVSRIKRNMTNLLASIDSEVVKQIPELKEIESLCKSVLLTSPEFLWKEIKQCDLDY